MFYTLPRKSSIFNPFCPEEKLYHVEVSMMNEVEVSTL